ncbi:hypothetical protein [Modestobacter marinus]|uniref:hypothetical protein n=1 Tax=Modestobacter marinus TaxID=477641 RepID=UPI001C9789B6|nr:hypothetical protein [Modestobacter marinus]
MTSIATLTHTTLREVARDARVEEVDQRVSRSVFWLPVVGAVVVAATLLHRPLFTALVREDGPLEWVQVTLFALASVLFAVAAWRSARRGDRLGCLLLAIGALGIFGIAGEEISWGQRIFDWSTPSELAAVNHQNETNIHNITAFPVQRIGNWLQLVLGAAGLVLPWLTRTDRPLVRARVLRLLSPPLFVTSCFGLLFAYRAIRFIWVSSVEIGPVVTFGEWPELTFALGLFVFALVLARRLAGPDPAAGTRESPRSRDHQPEPARP